jgi:hypothetical protein
MGKGKIDFEEIWPPLEIMSWQSSTLLRAVHRRPTYYATYNDQKVEFDMTDPDPVSFRSVTTFYVPELIAELVEDSLVDSGFNLKVDVRNYRVQFQWGWTNDYELKELYFLERDGFELRVWEDRIEFAGPDAERIDDTADIVCDENNLLAFLDWINNGGTFPFMKKKEGEDNG